MKLGGHPKPPKQESVHLMQRNAASKALQGSVLQCLCLFAEGPSSPDLCPPLDGMMEEGSLGACLLCQAQTAFFLSYLPLPGGGRTSAFESSGTLCLFDCSSFCGCF